MDLDSVEHIARLARLKINQDEAKHLQTDLSNILDLVAQLDKVDTEKVISMAHPFDTNQPLREDIVTENCEREALMQGAPSVAEGLFLVPQVIADDE